MTLTSSAPARPPRRRRLPRRFAMALVAALITGVLPPVAAAAAPSPAPAHSELSGEVVLTLSPVGQGIIRPGTPLSAAAVLQNGTADDLSATPVRLEIGASALPDRDALTAWLGGEGPASLTEIGGATIDPVTAGADAAAGILVAADDPALTGRTPGVYPLRATAEVGDEEVTATSVIVVPDDAVATPVAIVVPITAPPRASGLLGADALAELTSPEGTLTGQLEAVEGTAAILAVDPAIPAAIRALGSTAPETATEWLARLEALPNSRFALQFGDADLATQFQAGLTTPLQPTSLTSYLTATAAPSTPAPTAEATPGADPAAPVLPDLAQLTSIGPAAQAGVWWPATGTVGPDLVEALTAASGAGAPALTLLSSASTTDAVASRARAVSGDAQLLLYDSEASTALQRAADQEDTALRAAELTAATGYLSYAVHESAGQPLLVTVDRGTDRERIALRTAIATALSAPGAAPLSLAGLLGAEPVAVTVSEAEADTARAADLTQLVTDEGAIASFATILDDPSLLTGRQRAEILQLLAVSWRQDEDAWTHALASHREQTRDTLDAVGILPTSVLNLISYDATFAPWIRNDLPYPVHLVLVAQPNDPRLIVGERTEVVASAASNTRAAIPVQARIGNGAVTVTMQLYSPAGVPIGTVQSAEVEVRAEWETIGLVVLIALMVLFVSLGVFRTIRARRARRRPRDPLEPPVRSDLPSGTDGAS